MEMLPDVEEAVSEIRAAFPGHEVRAVPWGEGGAEVTVEEIELGEGFEPSNSFVGFRIDRYYPNSDVYSHYVRGDIRKTDGSALPNPGMLPNHEWQGRSAIMVSRRSTRWDANTDTALGKLYKVSDWIKGQA